MNKNTATIDLGSVDNMCFVVMPFHALFEAEYDRVIRPAVEEAGLKCVRGDEIYSHQSIIQDIWSSVKRCRMVVAELSDRNPNVMYEVGLAHAIGKPIILVTRNENDVPFDLKMLRYIFYDVHNPEWGQNLRSALTRQVRDVLDKGFRTAHLHGITTQADLPTAPSQPLVEEKLPPALPNLSGVWTTSWESTVSGRRHDATLMIPPEHGKDFTAAMTVVYVRDKQQTIVQETLTGAIRDRNVALAGISYTFVEQGTARTYGLDAFELTAPDDKGTMSGIAVLMKGRRAVVFHRTVNREAL